MAAFLQYARAPRDGAVCIRVWGEGGGATAAAGPRVFPWLAEQGGQQEARGGRGRDAPGRYASLVPSPRSGRRIRPQRDAFVTRVEATTGGQ